MSTSSGAGRKLPHVALLPSAGTGHLAPFARLAAAFASHSCDVSFVRLRLSPPRRIPHQNPPPRSPPRRPRPRPDRFPSTVDPFFLRFEAILRLAHLLPPLHASALIVDISLASAFLPVADALRLPCYVLFTSSAAMLALCAYFPTHITKDSGKVVDEIDIPGLRTMPSSSLPPPLRDPGHLFRCRFIENGQVLTKADGILVNTFQALEPEAMSTLNAGRVLPDLPPVFAIGPLRPLQSGC